MFTFGDLRLFLGFCTAVALLVVGFFLIARMSREPVHFRKRPIHRGTVVGGVLFGIGWALSGACPSIALVQLGEGQLAAIYTLVGMFAGNWLYGAVHMRFFRWDTGSCTDD